MTNLFALKIFLEIGATCLVLYGILHESELVDWEDRILGQLMVKTGLKAYLDNKQKEEARREAHRREAIRAARYEKQYAEYLAFERQAEQAARNRRAADALYQQEEAAFYTGKVA